MTVSPAAWEQIETEGVGWFRAHVGEVRLEFTTRLGGISTGNFRSLNLSHEVGDAPEAVTENRNRACRALGIDRLATMRQVHADRIIDIDDPIPGEETETDALCTGRPGIALGIKVADCLPVFVFHPAGACVGIAHCGWRGTAANLGPKLVRTMAERYHVPVSELHFSLGPCISPARYPVGPDVHDAFTRNLEFADEFLRPVGGPDARWTLDLRGLNRRLLLDAGLTEAPGLEHCTWTEQRLFYSARRDRTTGRSLAVIALRDRTRTGPKEKAACTCRRP